MYFDDYNLELLENEGHYTLKIDSYYGKAKKVVIPASIGDIPVTVIGNCAFLLRESLENVILSVNIEIIEDSAFKACSNLKEIYLPEGLTSIEDSAFKDCTNLREINLPESLTSIKDYAFNNCERLANVKFPENLVSIGDEAFRNCKKITNITIPKGLISIGCDTFFGCINLKEFIVDRENPAFTSCDGVIFDKNMTTLIMCPNGKEGEYIIPESIVNVEFTAFRYCNKLTKLIFPKEFMTLPHNSLYFCEQLEDISVNESNPLFSSVNGVLLDKEGSRLFQYPQNKGNTNYHVPNKVKEIEKCAFYNCRWLTKIILPESLIIIRDKVFRSCEQLSEITLPESLLHIGDEAFIDCPNLKTITLSRKTKIGYGTFNGFSGQIIYRD